MAVSIDKFELPMIATSYLLVLAKWAGKSYDRLCRDLSVGNVDTRLKCRYIKVQIDPINYAADELNYLIQNALKENTRK